MTEKKPFIKSEGNSRHKKSQKRQPTISARVKSFQGETATLEGYIYDIGIPNQSEVYTQTTKKIASYAGRNCREAHSMCYREPNETNLHQANPRYGGQHDGQQNDTSRSHEDLR